MGIATRLLRPAVASAPGTALMSQLAESSHSLKLTVTYADPPRRDDESDGRALRLAASPGGSPSAPLPVSHARKPRAVPRCIRAIVVGYRSSGRLLGQLQARRN